MLDTSDIERVHDMRVASRRLRAVLEIFAPCFPTREFSGVLRDVKALADALGERRDPDVHIDGAGDAFARPSPAADRAGRRRSSSAQQRERQARGNERAGRRAGATISDRDLRGRLLALADDAAEPA